MSFSYKRQHEGTSEVDECGQIPPPDFAKSESAVSAFRWKDGCKNNMSV